MDDVKCETESKENVVLESRVEIVVEGEAEGQGESSSRTSWGDADIEEGVWGKGRNGMNLPRREF